MMRRTIHLLVCLALPAIACAQAADFTPSAKASVASTPVALIYVVNAPQYTGPTNNGANQILAYTADVSGRLTAVPGSPFHEDVSYPVVNGKYLFALSNSSTNVNAYMIASNGSIKFSVATNFAQAAGVSSAAGGAMFIDHTGASLYLEGYDLDGMNNDGIYSFRVDKQTGALEYLGRVITGNFSFYPGVPASFSGNNVHAYVADGGCMYNQSWGFWRESNGNLHNFHLQSSNGGYNGNTIRNFPKPPQGYAAYEPELGAADPTNHVAFLLQPGNPPGCPAVSPQVASYTIDKWGFLSTTNTNANMPKSQVLNPTAMQMAPGGKLLVVSGIEGLQVFHFNGAAAPTAYTGLLTTDEIDEMFWDNNNHLYAISKPNNKLHVFTITPTSHSEAPGSPYTVKTPEYIIVQPMPL